MSMDSSEKSCSQTRGAWFPLPCRPSSLLGPRLRLVEQEFSTLADKLERVKGQAG